MPMASLLNGLAKTITEYREYLSDDPHVDVDDITLGSIILSTIAESYGRERFSSLMDTIVRERINLFLVDRTCDAIASVNEQIREDDSLHELFNIDPETVDWDKFQVDFWRAYSKTTAPDLHKTNVFAHIDAIAKTYRQYKKPTAKHTKAKKAKAKKAVTKAPKAKKTVVPADLATMKAVELQALAKKLGVNTKGTKPVLIARIRVARAE